MVGVRFCGPKCSIYCAAISIWGIVQLGIMGILFVVKSPAFLEDLLIDVGTDVAPATYIDAMEAAFSQTATNCWIATAMYAGTLVISGWQVWLNMKN